MKLEETLRTLFDANVEFVLIGGAAMQMQGIRDSEVPRKIYPFVSTPPQLNAN